MLLWEKTKQKIQQSRKEIYTVICSFGGEMLDEFERKKKIFWSKDRIFYTFYDKISQLN